MSIQKRLELQIEKMEAGVIKDPELLQLLRDALRDIKFKERSILQMLDNRRNEAR